mgnify:CR=1 FL=1
MFLKIKDRIKELAKNAVFIAESEFGKGSGNQKKEIALNYIIKHLPFAPLVKEIIALFLSSFIDDAIEAAVLYMNSLPQSQGE